MAAPWNRRAQLAFAGLLLLVVYVGSYLVLSRHGFAEARKYRAPGFIYGSWEAPPNVTPFEEWFHTTCTVVYAPINGVDVWLGGGMEPERCFPPFQLEK